MSTLDAEPGMLLCFIDESGDEDLSDARHPVFGMGGCAAMAQSLDLHLDRPWRWMKERHFGGADVPMHASAMRLSPKQQEALGTFFRRRRFMRFAAFVSSDTQMASDMDRVALLAPVVMRRLSEVVSAGLPRPSSLALIFEETERLGPAIQRHFSGMTLSDGYGGALPAEYCFAPKSAKMPGLEVADFVMHAAAGQVRARVKGQQRWRRDYQAVFQSGAGTRSFIDIASVEAGFIEKQEEALRPQQSAADDLAGGKPRE